MHTSPDVLALLALGERAGSASELDHVASCPFCASEVDQFRHAAELGRSGAEEKLYAPSPEVWERVVDELGLTRGRTAANHAAPDPSPEPRVGVVNLSERRAPQPEGPAGPDSDASAGASAGAEVIGLPDGSRPVRSGTRWAALAVAAAVGVVAGVGVTAAWNQANQPTATVIARADLEALPGFTGSSGEARVEQDASGRRTLVVTATDSRPGDGHEELWLLSADAKQLQNLGPFLPGQENRVNLDPGLDLRELPVVDVSAENDRNPAHSGVSIVRGELSL